MRHEDLKIGTPVWYKPTAGTKYVAQVVGKFVTPYEGLVWIESDEAARAGVGRPAHGNRFEVHCDELSPLLEDHHRPGAQVWYEPSPGVRYAAVVAAAPVFHSFDKVRFATVALHELNHAYVVAKYGKYDKDLAYVGAAVVSLVFPR